MKTKGQVLYEHKHPAQIRVVLYGKRQWATVEDSFMVPNPASPPAWNLITQADRDSYEQQAQGHFIFSRMDET